MTDPDPDPWLHNIDADMTAWLLLEAALCICEDEHNPSCPFCFYQGDEHE